MAARLQAIEVISGDRGRRTKPNPLPPSKTAPSCTNSTTLVAHGTGRPSGWSAWGLRTSDFAEALAQGHEPISMAARPYPMAPANGSAARRPAAGCINCARALMR